MIHFAKMFGRGMCVATIILQFIFIQRTMSTEVIPERAQIDFVNEKYMTNVSAYIKRYARRSPYYFNIEVTSMRTLGDDISCLQVIPERVNITYFNKKYIYNSSATVRRYNRQSAYYMNIEATTLHTWGNNVTVHLIFYEYLHNEYKRSFVEMHFRSCDMVHKDPYVGRAFANVFEKLGVTCPSPAGVYRLMNISVPMEDFPNLWPFERCKVEVILEQTPTKDIIGKGEVYVSFKQRLG